MIYQSETTPFEDFLILWGRVPIGTSNPPILGIFLSIVSIILLIIIFRLINSSINKKIKIQGNSPDFYNSLKLISRTISIILILFSICIFLEIPEEYITIVSGIIFTSITFASMKAINNFIAGAYIIITRPFSVGDFVDIKGAEGIVTEISLNYTTLKHKDASSTNIPNVSCLGSTITNYTISTEWYVKQITQLEEMIMNNHKQLIKNEDPGLRIVAERMNEELVELKEILKEIRGIKESFNQKNIEEEKLEKEEEKEIRLKINSAIISNKSDDHFKILGLLILFSPISLLNKSKVFQKEEIQEVFTKAASIIDNNEIFNILLIETINTREKQTRYLKILIYDFIGIIIIIIALYSIFRDYLI